MDGEDADTWLAYYCFVNRNWPPSFYLNLPYRCLLYTSDAADE